MRGALVLAALLAALLFAGCWDMGRAIGGVTNTHPPPARQGGGDQGGGS